jgi:hypothetical protein
MTAPVNHDQVAGCVAYELNDGTFDVWCDSCDRFILVAASERDAVRAAEIHACAAVEVRLVERRAS